MTKKASRPKVLLFNTSQFIYLKYLITLILHVILQNTKVQVLSLDESCKYRTLNLCHYMEEV